MLRRPGPGEPWREAGCEALREEVLEEEPREEVAREKVGGVGMLAGLLATIGSPRRAGGTRRRGDEWREDTCGEGWREGLRVGGWRIEGIDESGSTDAGAGGSAPVSG